MTKNLRRAALAFSLLAAAPAFAQESDPAAAPASAPENRNITIVGVGAAVLPDYEGSNDYRWAPAPVVLTKVAGFGFELVGNRASIDLINDRSDSGLDVQFGPTATLNLNRTSIKSIDDPRIKALGELDTAVEVGGFFGISQSGVITSPYDRLSVRASYRHDVSKVSRAGVFTPSVTYMTPLSRKALVTTFVSANRVEHGYAQTYFGVTPEGSLASGLPVYNAQGGWKDWTVGLGGAMSLTGDLTHGLQLIGGGTYRQLIHGFGDSPIVRTAGSRNQWMGMVGLAYSF